MKILIVGGYGTFGGWLVDLLGRDQNLHSIVVEALWHCLTSA